MQAAAKAYFDREAKDLNLQQSAVLASVLNDPNDLDPAQGKKAKRELLGRYQAVLGAMADEGMISAEEADKASRKLPEFPELEQESQYGGQRGHVLTMVRNELIRLGFDEDEIEGGGLKVTTTFTQKAMTAAQEGVAEVRPTGLPEAIPGSSRAAPSPAAATRTSTSASPASSPAPARCAASSAARTTSTPSSTGRSRAARPARR